MRFGVAGIDCDGTPKGSLRALLIAHLTQRSAQAVFCVGAARIQFEGFFERKTPPLSIAPALRIALPVDSSGQPGWMNRKRIPFAG